MIQLYSDIVRFRSDSMKLIDSEKDNKTFFLVNNDDANKEDMR